MSYIYSNKQTFADQFMPLKSTQSRQVRYAPTSSNTTMIQFSQIGPRNFREVMTNLKFVCSIKATYTKGNEIDPQIFYKNFNYAITMCQVNINGSNNLSLPLSIMAPVYESYNKRFAFKNDHLSDFNETVYIKSRYSVGANDGIKATNITDEIKICTSLYHPWLCAPYLGGINNMDITLNLNLNNIVANTLKIDNVQFEISDIFIIYDTYQTDNEIFSILLPYFKYTEKTIKPTDTQGQFNTTDFKTAPLKIFVSGTYDYQDTNINKNIDRTKSIAFNRAQFNINNITDAYNSNDIMALYHISKNAGYLKSFNEFTGDIINRNYIEYSDNHIVGSNDNPDANFKKYNTFNPCCIGLDLKDVDVNIGTDELFRFEATMYFDADASSDRKMFIVYMYPSLFVSTRTKTDIITAESLAGKELLATFAYEDFDDDYYGFGFWDKIKNFGKKAISFVKDNNLVSKGLSMAAPMLSNINPALGAVAGTAGNIAGNLGFSTKAF